LDTRPGDRSGSRHEFQVLVRLPGRSGQFIFLKKIKTTCKIKNKNQRVATGFFDRVLPGQPARPHRVFLSHVFFQPDPIPAPGQPGPGSIRRAGFKNYNRNHQIYISNYKSSNRIGVHIDCKMELRSPKVNK